MAGFKVLPWYVGKTYIFNFLYWIAALRSHNVLGRQCHNWCERNSNHDQFRVLLEDRLLFIRNNELLLFLIGMINIHIDWQKCINNLMCCPFLLSLISCRKRVINSTWFFLSSFTGYPNSTEDFILWCSENLYYYYLASVLNFSLMQFRVCLYIYFYFVYRWASEIHLILQGMPHESIWKVEQLLIVFE